MSDERLRELERRWKETGSAQDEAAYLLERVRMGDLAQKGLELAAYLGHPAAKLSARDSFKLPDAKTGIYGYAVEGWCSRLRAWDKPVFVCLAVACAEVQPRSDLTRVEDALSKAKAWLGCPCERHRSEAANCETVGLFHVADMAPKEVRERALAASYAALSAGATTVFPPDAAFEAPEEWMNSGAFSAFDGAMCALVGEGADPSLGALPEAVLGLLVDWALGRTRDQGRQGSTGE